MKKLFNILIICIFTIIITACNSKYESTVTTHSNQIMEYVSGVEENNKTMLIPNTNLQQESVTVPKDNSILPSNTDSTSDMDSLNSNLQHNQKAEDINSIIPMDIRDISSIELVKDIKIGWNLGNTFDATGKDLTSEIAWGNPFTTKENIDKVKEAGFNLVRIPTTWENHLTSTVSYTIHPAWLERVKEVVDYAIDNEMYVILNLHHEEWHYPSYENEEDAEEILIALWTQIGNYFKDYDEHLIFEGLNEPRMKGSKYEWTSGTPESRDIINKLNLAFIHTIRNLDGNNNKRHLMIPPYAASSNKDTWNDFVIPNDDKIIVSIHGYIPYDFALNKEGASEFRSVLNQHTSSIDELMDNIDTYFLQNNIPVIIGEFGAVDKNNLQDRIAWSTYYIQTATQKGIPCVWWDNGAFIGDDENFGLLDRRNNIWVFPEIIDALMNGLDIISLEGEAP